MKQVNIVIPSVFIRFTAGKSICPVNATTVRDSLMELVNRHPDLRSQLLADDGQLLAHLQVFVNEDNIRDRDGVETELRDRDEVLIIPALAGG